MFLLIRHNAQSPRKKKMEGRCDHSRKKKDLNTRREKCVNGSIGFCLLYCCELSIFPPLARALTIESGGEKLDRELVG